MSTPKAKLLYLFATIALILACGPGITITPAPTVSANEINTIIVQTANAASTQTAAAQPSPTLTPSITPTQPTITPSPTATSTVIFILSTPTAMVIPTFTFISSGGSGTSVSSSADFACQIVSVSPPNGTSMGSRNDFDTTWKVKNIGQKTWDRNSVDFVYFSGTEMHKVAGYDMSTNVQPGNQIDLGVDMVAPKDPGNYTTTWALMRGNDDFCRMSLTINVR